MKYVYDAQAVVALALGLFLLVIAVKVFFLDPRKKKQGQ